MFTSNTLSFGAAPQIALYKNKIKSNAQQSNKKDNSLYLSNLDAKFEEKSIHSPFSPQYSPGIASTPITDKSSKEPQPNIIADDKLSCQISDVLGYSLDSKKNFSSLDLGKSKASLKSFVMPIHDISVNPVNGPPKAYKRTEKVHTTNISTISTSTSDFHLKNPFDTFNKQRQFLATPQRVEFRRMHEVPLDVCVRCRVSITL